MAYGIDIRSGARRDIRQLQRSNNPIVARIDTAILALASDPRPSGVIKLQAEEGVYRVRVGDYRILYGIDDERQCVAVDRVVHRREAYGR